MGFVQLDGWRQVGRNKLRIDVVHHVGFHGVRREGRSGAEALGNITTGFSGGTEIGRAQCPAHLQGCWDNQHDVSRGVIIWQSGQDIAEGEFIGFGDTHAPEAVFDVNFGKQHRAFVIGKGGNEMNEAAEHIS